MRFCLAIALFLFLGSAGCDSKPAIDPAMQERITKAMAKLPPEDRTLAEQQKFCAVETENLLGGMGKPHKVMVDGQPVFLCCAGCEEAALKDPKETLAKVAKLKGK